MSNTPAEIKLVEEIISMYHTTRLSEVPFADHILSKPSVQHALANLRQDTLSMIRHCDDCDFSTIHDDVSICPDKGCNGIVG